jgi:bacillithiol biosynthesis cysteine-adding enzyme BshC
MNAHHIPFQKTGYFSKLICDYLDKIPELDEFYGNFPDLEGFKNQLQLKSNFESSKRALLVSALKEQYRFIQVSESTSGNIHSLEKENTFTIATGHQLNIFTGPLYFLYKIVSTLNVAKQLKKAFPEYNFVPVYWMATEDHDFDEINFFNFKMNKISWKRNCEGAVGRLNNEALDEVFGEFSKLIGSSKNADYLKGIFKKSYLENNNLASATRTLVNELFGNEGLVIIDGDDRTLKELFVPYIEDELMNFTSYDEVLKSIEKLKPAYKVQVNPRKINLFYLKDGLRERIVFENNNYLINNTDTVFSREEILQEVSNYPERFSPNVIMRPFYQELILPNLCYIGGGGELAYWLQLKAYFDKLKIPYPILLLRNSVLFASKKQLNKLKKLNITHEEIFLKQEALINKKVKEASEIEVDFSEQKAFLTDQFETLKELAKKTDRSFIGAVNAQEKKQHNGLDKLEKRLLKAQKRKLSDRVERIKILQDELFPNQSLGERTRNFSEVYLEMGPDLIPALLRLLDPLRIEFAIIETS